MCYCTVLLCFVFHLRAISKYRSQGAYIQRGDLTDGFLCCKFEGLWRSLYMEGLIFGFS